MKISETKAEGLLREFSIVITAAEIEEQVSAKLTELNGQLTRAQLPLLTVRH